MTATAHRRPRIKHASIASAKVPRTYRLAPAKLARAQRILGAATATETIETALDMIVFRRELLDGTLSMRGVRIDPSEPDNA